MIVVWVVEETWPACVDAVRRLAPPAQAVTLLHVAPAEVTEAAAGAFAGLLGRGRRDRDPGRIVYARAGTAGVALLRAAQQRLGRPADTVERTGRVEREVVAAARDAELLVVARDGDVRRVGPASLAPPTRFVVDHAPCPVLLVWPDGPPDPQLPPLPRRRP